MILPLQLLKTGANARRVMVLLSIGYCIKISSLTPMNPASFHKSSSALEGAADCELKEKFYNIKYISTCTVY